MRLNIKQPVMDYEGNPILINKVDPAGKPMLDEDHRVIQEPEALRNYLATALNNAVADEVMTPEQKSKIYELTRKLYPVKGNDVDLTLDDRAFMKDRVGKVYGPLIFGRICEILEGRDGESSQAGGEEA